MSVPAAPLNPMSRNVGNGSLECSWSPSAGAVSYNAYLGLSSGAPFGKANIGPIRETVVRLPNIPFGTKVYVKVTAVNASGESAQSSLAQDAVCSPGTTTLQFQDMIGAQIPAGKLFYGKAGTRRVAFVTTTSGICA